MVETRWGEETMVEARWGRGDNVRSKVGERRQRTMKLHTTLPHTVGGHKRLSWHKVLLNLSQQEKYGYNKLWRLNNLVLYQLG